MRRLLVLLGAWAALASPAAAQENRSFGDWWAACDARRTCTAFGFADAAESDAFVRVRRGGEAGAEPVLMFAAVGDREQAVSSAVQMTVSVEGGGGMRLTPATARVDPEGTGFYVLEVREPAVVRPLLEAIRRGDRLTLTVEGWDAPGVVSLKGATAALLWMDERQRRVDTVTALVRRGAKPASAVPAPPAERWVTAAKPVAQGRLPTRFPRAIEAHPAVRSCREEDGERRPDVFAARLGGGRMLWGVGCEHGAYNQLYAMFLGDEAGRGLRPVPLDPDGETPGNVVMNPDFNPDGPQLTAFAKGRGIGDCGSEQVWTWDGRAFVLTAEARMEECRGVPVRYWPLTRSATVGR